jgi:hypothetical protein
MERGVIMTRAIAIGTAIATGIERAATDRPNAQASPPAPRGAKIRRRRAHSPPLPPLQAPSRRPSRASAASPAADVAAGAVAGVAAAEHRAAWQPRSPAVPAALRPCARTCGRSKQPPRAMAAGLRSRCLRRVNRSPTSSRRCHLRRPAPRSLRDRSWSGRRAPRIRVRAKIAVPTSEV